ncbi:hypothetical protein [Sporolactobacillus laevolacticus]|uniref:Uncharacterized protein n=1 Tax=Sporolactobacillus laevolacticus DSM 442 TaxID=1395513 RepID=V6IWN1_9BACL|nr:hypothetical protein [Sporolactobacillus laevolacticus]EST11006.1 hypothetical protein P343_14390 [Sporolactobacillus laevolacticus DSM 442]
MSKGDLLHSFPNQQNKKKTVIDKLIHYLENDRFDIKETSYGDIEVRISYDNVVDQEVFYSLKENGGEFTIFRVSRGIYHRVITLKNKYLAFFYLGVLSKDSIAEEIRPLPEAFEYIDEIANGNLKKAEKVTNKYLSADHYAMFHLKRESICIIKKQNVYIVNFVDCEGKAQVISDDNDEIGLGMMVLCNYTWSLMWLDELTDKWSPDNNKKTLEYLKIQSHFLNVKEGIWRFHKKLISI